MIEFMLNSANIDTTRRLVDIYPIAGVMSAVLA
jgi:hypothetical protein